MSRNSRGIARRAGFVASVCFGMTVLAEGPRQAVAPTNDLPNPYQTVADYFKLPAGRTYGLHERRGHRQGRPLDWVVERCGVNSCADPATGQMSPLDPVLKFDASGRLVKSFGAGIIPFAHGIHVDRDGNVWVTDASDNHWRPSQPSWSDIRSSSSAPTARSS